MRSKTHRTSSFPGRKLVLMLTIASLVRCSDAPTEPPRLQTPEPTPTPVVVPLDLNGEWTWKPNENSSTLRVHVQHLGSRVTFEWRSYYEFTGTLNRGILTGHLVEDGYWRYDLSGPASQTRIRMTGEGRAVELTR